MNFLECEYSSNGGTPTLLHRDIHIPLPLQAKHLEQKNNIPKKVLLGIRPFYVGINSQQTDVYNIPANVFIVEPMGDMAIVIAKVYDTRLQVVTTPDFRAQLNQPIWLSFDPEHTHLFDIQTQMALVNGKR